MQNIIVDPLGYRRNGQEGDNMKKAKKYLIMWESVHDWGMEYVMAMTTQQAVDSVREWVPEDATIKEVAEVRNNWK